jgi:hypothetical protein
MTSETPKGGNSARRYNRGKTGTHPLDKAFQPKPGGVVEEIGGDELQRLTVTWQDEPALMGPDDFWRALEEILAECDAAMLRHGWNRKAGNGRNFPNERMAKPFSELYFAGKISLECWNLLTHHRPHEPNPVALA